MLATCVRYSIWGSDTAMLPTAKFSPSKRKLIDSIARGWEDTKAPHIECMNMPLSRAAMTTSEIRADDCSFTGANSGIALNAFFQKSDRFLHAIGISAVGTMSHPIALSISKALTK